MGPLTSMDSVHTKIEFRFAVSPSCGRKVDSPNKKLIKMKHKFKKNSGTLYH